MNSPPKNYIFMRRGDLSPNFIKDEPFSPEQDFNGNNDDYGICYGKSAQMRRSLSFDDVEMNRVGMRCHFQRDTPARFRSRPKNFRQQAHLASSHLTVPQSPMLRCKLRSRSHHILSQTEREEIELENIRKHKIKALPVPRSLFECPNLPEVPVKPVTVPEPFNLTEIPKREVEHIVDVHRFKARPAPKHIFDSPHVPEKITLPTTVPISPNISKRARQEAPKEDPIKKGTSIEKLNHGPVKPIPFSFQKRDEELKRRKEERIKQQIEEERKLASQFKAHPLPIAVKKIMQSVSKGSSSTTSSENKENFIKFEARKPKVLYKEPFKPVLQSENYSVPAPFKLASEERALEREKFNQKIKQKEEEMKNIKLKHEKEIAEREEIAKAILRAQLVHHPKPCPNVQPFVPSKSNQPVTVPDTPKFIRKMRTKNV